MTYNVSSGTLDLTHSLTPQLLAQVSAVRGSVMVLVENNSNNNNTTKVNLYTAPNSKKSLGAAAYSNKCV